MMTSKFELISNFAGLGIEPKRGSAVGSDRQGTVFQHNRMNVEPTLVTRLGDYLHVWFSQ